MILLSVRFLSGLTCLPSYLFRWDVYTNNTTTDHIGSIGNLYLGLERVRSYNTMNSVSSKSQGAKSPKQFQLPAVLNDELRAQALYAPFRERSVNPENYDSKMKFWKDIILEFCLHRGTSTFSKYELLQTFSIGQRVPSCLDTVIGEMQRSGLIRPRLEYEYDPSNGWTGWAVLRFWKTPLHKIKNAVLSPNSGQQDHMFVHLTAMKVIHTILIGQSLCGF